MEICKQCEWFSENKRALGYNIIRLDEHCTNCGCPTGSKLRCLSCECPVKKWKPLLKTEEEYELKAQANGSEKNDG